MPIISPSTIYRDYLEKNQLQSDPQQLSVLEFLDHECFYLNSGSNIFLRLLHRQKKIKGVYLWGSVGIGKTFLMDCFYDALTRKKKRRIHFHHFMQEVHAKLQEYSGHINPLSLVAKLIRKQVEVLCLDEFFVTDIVDAMLLAGLLEALFKAGIYFVTTSNIPPQLLYKNGLRRDSFLPAIALLKKDMHIIHLASKTDYRLRQLQIEGVYFTPLNSMTEEKMKKAFMFYAHENFITQPLYLLNREVPVVRFCEGAAWFRFDVLCGDMRSKEDYLALANQFKLIFLSDVPVLTLQSLNTVMRFIQLVDIFYDAKVKLIISAEVFPDALYTSGKLIFEFQRIVSRLIEMQSEKYF